MCEALTDRLDKIENEIKLLLMLQKKPDIKNCDGFSVEEKKSQKRRPKSAVDVSRKLALLQQKRRRREIESRRSASSTGISRQSSSSPNAIHSASSRSPSPPPSPSGASPVRQKRSSQKTISPSRGSVKRSSKNEKKHSKQGLKKDEMDSCVACCKATKNEKCCEKTSEKKISFELEKTTILEEEVISLKELVNELNKSRTTALTVCKQWHDKYNDLKSQKCSCKQTHKDYKAQLTTSLEEERSKLKKAMGDLQDSQGQLQSYKLTCKKYEETLNAAKAKNKYFEYLDEENKTLRGKCESFEHEFEMMREKYEQLQNTNQTFAKDVLNRCKCFENSTAKAEKNLQKLKSENEKLQGKLKEMSELKKAADLQAKKDSEAVKSLKSQIGKLQNSVNKFKTEDAAKSKEISDLKQTLLESSKTCECSSNVTKLKDEISKLNEEKEAYRKEIVGLNETLMKQSQNKEKEELTKKENMRKAEESLKKEGCCCAKKFEADKVKMKEMITGLQKEVKDKEKCATERCTSLECKLEQTTKLYKETEERLQFENGELRALAEELTDIILKQKNRIEEMSDLSKKHKEMVEVQSKEIECKNCELSGAEEELADIRRKYDELEKNLAELSSSMESDMMVDRCGMEREIDALNKLLEDETHKLHIKEKIIEDQSNTISHLKKKLSENDDKVAMLYKELNLHKKEKNELNEKISQLNEEKKCISQDFIRSHQDLDRQHVIIENLERKIILQNREWELHTEIQVREKEKALTAAQFASEKLMETIHDFQKQTESQCQVRNLLATLLQEKDDKLRSAIKEISSLTCNLEMEMGVRVTEICDPTKGSKGRNETSDSNESFASCRGSFMPETMASVKSVTHSVNRFNPAIWYQINPANVEDSTDGIEEVLPAAKGCTCSESSGPFDARGTHLQSKFGSQIPLLKCGCIKICRCSSDTTSYSFYPD